MSKGFGILSLVSGLTSILGSCNWGEGADDRREGGCDRGDGGLSDF